jgi:biopolymer transport protein ExbB
MSDNIEWAHTLTFYILYAFAGLATFVNIERLIFYTRTAAMARKLMKAVPHDIDRVDQVPGGLLKVDSLPSKVVKEMLERRMASRGRHEVEDASMAIFTEAKAMLNRHLWILDTVVTASPLLGLLGTILGIIDTFTSLAQSGISDPAGVSAGIGTALFATALGISVALYGLLFHNAFHERVSRISDYLKVLLIRAGTHEHVGLRREAA